jgi:hypothetical protein
MGHWPAGVVTDPLLPTLLTTDELLLLLLLTTDDLLLPLLTTDDRLLQQDTQLAWQSQDWIAEKPGNSGEVDWN